LTAPALAAVVPSQAQHLVGHVEPVGAAGFTSDAGSEPPDQATARSPTRWLNQPWPTENGELALGVKERLKAFPGVTLCADHQVVIVALAAISRKLSKTSDSTVSTRCGIGRRGLPLFTPVRAWL